MNIQFAGAARQVTGSCYYLEGRSCRFLVDCGLHQERDHLDRNWDPFPFDPGRLDAVFLTHVHLDHSGLLPRLVKEGFRGPVYATDASGELLPIVLEDSAHIQVEDAEFKQKRHKRQGRRGPHPEIPLYTVEDAAAVRPLVRTVAYEKPVPVRDGVTVVFHDAGHILGSAMIEIVAGEGGTERRIIFSGDIGQWGKPIVCDPTVFSQADEIVMESTYGDRDHEDIALIPDLLSAVIVKTVRAGGNILIPTFAVERAQDLLYYLSRLSAEKRIPRIMAFLDSPMAVDVTEVFEKNRKDMEPELRAEFEAGRQPFRFPGLELVRTPEESKAINAIRGSCLIMAGSGMCNGGRIKHHLTLNISRPECAVVFVGYQARGTLGREILEGRSPVRIHGDLYPVRAGVSQIEGFSAHADRKSLLRWLSHFQKPPRHLFLVHGEPEVSEGLGEFIRQTWSWPVSVPGRLEKWNLD
jgi:metallo-beta-lactamase family protein